MQAFVKNVLINSRAEAIEMLILEDEVMKGKVALDKKSVQSDTKQQAAKICKSDLTRLTFALQVTLYDSFSLTTPAGRRLHFYSQL